MQSEMRGFPGEMAISLVYPSFRWDIPRKKVSFDSITYILVDLWFLFPNLCVSQLYVSSIVGAACGGLNEPEAWKLHVLGLCLGVCTFTCTLPAFVLTKIMKKYNPGKTREIAKNTPRIAGNPREFFFDLDHSEVQRFFPFSDVCL